MKVLVVAPGLTARGGIVSVLRLHMVLPAWKAMNCELLSTYADRNVLRKIALALTAYLKAPFKIAKADIVHVHLAGQVSLLRKLPIAATTLLLGKRLIVHVHASSPDSLFCQTPSWAVRFVLGRADLILALSNSWADTIRCHLPQAKISVLPNPVRIFSAAKERLVETVLFVGKLEARKGYDTLLQAIPAILQKHPQTRFVFAGHGELDNARNQAARLGIASSVSLLGWTGEAEMERLYRNASIFCLPSRNEGVPMSVLEAMSHGVPVVCTPVGGLPEFIAHGRNGLLTSVGDPHSIAENILLLLDNPQYAASLGSAGRRTVQQLCSLDVVDEKLQKIYTELQFDRRNILEAEKICG